MPPVTAVEAKLSLAGPGQDFSGLAKAHKKTQACGPHQFCVHLLMSSFGADMFFHEGLAGWQECSIRHQEFRGLVTTHIVTLGRHFPALFPHSPLAI